MAVVSLWGEDASTGSAYLDSDRRESLGEDTVGEE